jgi:hypothetical protein
LNLNLERNGSIATNATKSTSSTESTSTSSMMQNMQIKIESRKAKIIAEAMEEFMGEENKITSIIDNDPIAVTIT